MSDDKKYIQPDAGEAAERRPIPSQAEGEDDDTPRDAGDRPRPSQAEGEDRQTSKPKR